MTPISRRQILTAALAYPAAQTLGLPALAEPGRGGRLIAAILTEPTVLTGGITTEGPVQWVSGKIFDGLVTYDANLTPKPQLALSWSAGADGLSYSFKLRPGVLWHDGKPFTSEDVAYSVLNIWRKFHSRGRSTYANVVAAETPDPLSVTLRLSKPSPYILAALSSVESQVLPKHLYDGTDILTNPRNAAPIGTGPFRFVEWNRGNYIALERNPTYWDQGKPNLDKVIIRIIPTEDGIANALETGEIQVSNGVGVGDRGRLTALPTLELDPAPESSTTYDGLGFNLDRPYFHDVRVRQAFAHVIDTAFIKRTIYYGQADIETGPLPPSLKDFYDPDVPSYPFDLAKAAQLLDAAGLTPDKNGIRLSVFYDPLPTRAIAFRIAEYVREALGKVGVRVQIRNEDFATYIRRVYTQRDMDLFYYAGSAGPDPAIGTQRLYWSKNFQPGVAFSNGTHYQNAEVDSLLEAAQTEMYLPRRCELYKRFQQIAQTELPFIPLVTERYESVKSRRLQDFHTDSDGFMGNWAAARLLPT